MTLTDEQLRHYATNGYVLLPAQFSRDEVELLKAPLPHLFGVDNPRRVMEKDGRTVRSIFGCHATHQLFRRLSRDSRILDPVEQILGSKGYIHQFKINAKLRFSGDTWVWHQDFLAWLKEDRICRPDLVTATLFLDEVNEFNGPLLVIPGSHRHGLFDASPRDGQPSAHYGAGEKWVKNLIVDLKHPADSDAVSKLARYHGIAAPKGPAGSLLLFHANLFHASVPNVSPSDRMLALITYNSPANAPVEEGSRPDFLSGRDYTPIEADDTPFGHGEQRASVG
jgi:ectoine hydroxylase